MTNFQKVVEFNEQFGIQTFDSPQTNIVQTDPKLIEYRMSLIREEVKELEESIQTNDFTETVDALADILYVVYGMGSSIGVDLDKAFDIVHQSNMSKLCTTEAQAQETVAWYKQKYLEKQQPYDTPAYRKSVCGKLWVVYNESTNKILKSINYTPADFSTMF